MEKQTSNAGLFTAVGLIGADLIAILATLLELKGGLFWFGVLWFFLFALTLLAQDNEKDAKRIERIINRTDNLRLYDILTTRILNGLARVITPDNAQDDPCPQTGFWAKVGWYVTPRAVDPADAKRLRETPWSWPVMDFALKLAVIYPLLLLLAQWTFTGQDTGIGVSTILPAEDRDIVRYVTFGILALYLSLFILASATRQRVDEKAAGRLFFAEAASAVAFASACVIAVASAGVIAGVIAVEVEATSAVAVAVAVAAPVPGAFAVAAVSAFAVAVAAAFAVASAGVIAVEAAGAVAGAPAVAVAAAVGYACQIKQGGRGYGLLILFFYFSLTLVLATAAPFQEDDRKSLVFALGFLPLLNAVFDYLSYAATITLIKIGARKKGLTAIGLAFVDAGLAYCLLVGLGCFIVLTLGLINAQAAAPFLDITAILDGLKDPATRGQYTWLYLTLFSTLIPTGVHVVIGILSFTTWLPLSAKRWMTHQINSPDTGNWGTLGGGALVALFGALSCFAVAVPIYFCGVWVADNLAWIGETILSHVEWVAVTAGILS